MSKKKHPEHVNHERWLVSYADFITLLFAFFVVLFASSQADKKKTTALASAMQSAFAQYGIFEAHAKTPTLTPDAGAAQTPSLIAPPLPSPNPVTESKLETDVRQAVARNAPNGSITVRRSREGLVLSLREAGFFDSGSADIHAAALPLLARLAASLPPQPLRIEGHTDNMPIHNQQFRSNWELSTARANAIARVLMEQSTIPPSSFSIAGYGEFHPIVVNATEAARAQNRRVDIVLLSPSVATSLRQAP